jgi:serine/threonine-protein kinase HipA
MLKVFLNSTLVGTLSRPTYPNRSTEFKFDPGYLLNPARPTLGINFIQNPEDVWRATSRLPAWFSNLLPEGELRELVAKQYGILEQHEWEMLTLLGSDLPGAVVIEPVASSEDIVQDDGSSTADSSTEPPTLFKFSLAGVQLKLSANSVGDRLTLPSAGTLGSIIVKLPSVSWDLLPEHEFSIMTWARLSGISTPDFWLQNTSDIENLSAQYTKLGSSVFCIRRFDRAGSQRVHFEDFAQVFNVFTWGDKHARQQKYNASNYDTIANLVKRLCPNADIREFYRRIVFMVLSGNGDAHIKNWAIWYPDARQPELAPAYDLVSTQGLRSLAPSELDDKLALRLGGTKEFAAVDQTRLLRIAQRINLSEGEVSRWISEDSALIRQVWADNANAWPLSDVVRRAIEAHLKAVKL